MGRSIGSGYIFNKKIYFYLLTLNILKIGPATYISSKYKLGGLVLLSPFTSIRDVVKDTIGWFTEYLIKPRFNNLLYI